MAINPYGTTISVQMPVTLSGGKKYTKTFNNIDQESFIDGEGFDSIMADYVALFEPGSKTNTGNRIETETYKNDTDIVAE